MKNLLIAILHYLIAVLALSLPFWLDWKVVALVVILYHLVFTRRIGFCPLTVWQFGTAAALLHKLRANVILQPFFSLILPSL